jgi:hypothetical protein
MESFLNWLGNHWASAGSLLIAALSAVFSGFALGQSRGQTKVFKRQAEAAEVQNALLQRQVEAQEAQIQSHPSDGLSSRSDIYVPPWVLRWHKGDTYELINGGNETEYNIQIEFPEPSFYDEAEWDSIGPRSSKTFLFAASLATPGRGVTVTWSRDPEGNDTHSWESPIPPKG